MPHLQLVASVPRSEVPRLLLLSESGRVSQLALPQRQEEVVMWLEENEDSEEAKK